MIKCEWPGCDADALCRSGNFGDKLVCREHFQRTNGHSSAGQQCRVVCMHNPERAVLLVGADFVLLSNVEHFIGRPMDEAIASLYSTMRYRLGTEAHETSADGYPTRIEL